MHGDEADRREDEAIQQRIREMQEEERDLDAPWKGFLDPKEVTEDLKCATFHALEVSDEVRQAMDADRAKAEEEQSREFTLEFDVQDRFGGPSSHDQPAILIAYLVMPDGTKVEKGSKDFDTGKEASDYLRKMIEETCRSGGNHVTGG